MHPPTSVVTSAFGEMARLGEKDGDVGLPSWPFLLLRTCVRRQSKHLWSQHLNRYIPSDSVDVFLIGTCVQRSS